MFTMTAKYNSANVMLPDVGSIDEATKTQIYGFLNHPAFRGSYIAIMPDCHAGMGAVIGFTMPMNDYVIPNMVGVDIGCGMLAIKLVGVESIDLDLLDKAIHCIPSGFSRYPQDLKFGTPYMRNLTVLDGTDISAVAGKVGADYADVICSLGTLGGGNHFIEVDKDEEGAYWLIIHTGSRNLGLKVANYHQQKARDLLKQMFIGDEYKTLEFLPMNNGGDEYIADMHLAQGYASLNRTMIANSIVVNFFKKELSTLPTIESVHNYINPGDNIIRKGAISAYEGERLIIPLNMRDGTILGIGKGSKKWNYSAPHGAGRIMSRKRAKAEIALTDYTASMDGIFSTCVNPNTLDEAPMAYKDKELILDAIGETVDVVTILKPVYNFKASED